MSAPRCCLGGSGSSSSSSNWSLTESVDCRDWRDATTLLNHLSWAPQLPVVFKVCTTATLTANCAASHGKSIEKCAHCTVHGTVYTVSVRTMMIMQTRIVWCGTAVASWRIEDAAATATAGAAGRSVGLAWAFFRQHRRIFVGVVVVWKLTRCCHAVWLRLLLFSASSSAVFAADPLSALLRVLSPPFGKQTETGTPTATLGLATALGTWHWHSPQPQSQARARAKSRWTCNKPKLSAQFMRGQARNLLIDLNTRREDVEK